MHLQQLIEGMQRSKLVCVGVHFSDKRYTKGAPFLSKTVYKQLYKNARDWTSGSPNEILLIIPGSGGRSLAISRTIVRLAINETLYTQNTMINIFRDMFNLLGLFLYTSGFVLKMFTPPCMSKIMR